MKTSILTIALAVAAVSGTVAASAPAHAQSWMDIARQPVPSYQPFRGYYGSQTYIGQTYAPGPGGGSLGAGAMNPGQGLAIGGDSDDDDSVGGVLRDLLDEDCF